MFLEEKIGIPIVKVLGVIRPGLLLKSLLVDPI